MTWRRHTEDLENGRTGTCEAPETAVETDPSNMQEANDDSQETSAEENGIDRENKEGMMQLI
jgi:hypothetical protein